MAKRAKRTTAAQYSAMLRFMVDNEEFSRGKLTSVEGRRARTTMWNNLAVLLNNDPTGPEKDASQWQKVWVDWKCSARKKGARLRAHVQGTGGGPEIPASERPTPVDEALLEFLGPEAVAGNESVPESGVEGQAPIITFAPLARNTPPRPGSSLEVQEVFVLNRDEHTFYLESDLSDEERPMQTSKRAAEQPKHCPKKKKISSAPSLAPPLSADTLRSFGEASERSAKAKEDMVAVMREIRDQETRKADALIQIANMVTFYLENKQ